MLLECNLAGHIDGDLKKAPPASSLAMLVDILQRDVNLRRAVYAPLLMLFRFQKAVALCLLRMSSECGVLSD